MDSLSQWIALNFTYEGGFTLFLLLFCLLFVYGSLNRKEMYGMENRESEKRIKKSFILISVTQFIILILVYAASQFNFIAIYSTLVLVKAPHRLIASVLYGIAILTLAFIIKVYINENSAGNEIGLFNFRKHSKESKTGWMIAGFFLAGEIILLGLTMVLRHYAAIPFAGNTVPVLLSYYLDKSIFLAVPAIILMVAFEEFIFRYFLVIKRTRYWKITGEVFREKDRAFWIVSSVLYMLMHPVSPGWCLNIGAFLFSYFLFWYREKSDFVFFPFLVHLIHNLMLLAYFNL